jgi:hypothetical protein
MNSFDNNLDIYFYINIYPVLDNIFIYIENKYIVSINNVLYIHNINVFFCTN